MAKSVDSYGTKLLSALLLAAEKGIRLPCPEKSKATALRHRMYSLRQAMKKENHPDYPAVTRVSFTIEERGDSWHLIGRSADASFDDILDAAGIEEPDAPEIDL